MIIKGKVHKYGDNIDTDVIIPARYLNVSEPQELAKHCMEDIDQSFVDKVEIGDVIVAGNNFGCGSSREHAPIAIKAAGISIIIAKSFARIFFRNSINIGLAIMECKEVCDECNNQDILEIDLEKGLISNLTLNKTYQAISFPDFINDIINNNGLINYTKKSLED